MSTWYVDKLLKYTNKEDFWRRKKNLATNDNEDFSVHSLHVFFS